MKKETKITNEEKVKYIVHSNSLESIPVMYLPDVFSNEYFFISYSHLDYVDVYIDLLRLQNAGLHFWYDRGMSAGSDWEEIARRNISPFGCKGVLFYISENALKSKAVLGELEFAFSFGKPVILVMMPFKNKKYVDENGRPVVGKTFDIVKTLDILRFNDVVIEDLDNKIERLQELFSSNIIYLPLDTEASKKKELLHNKIKEIPVLDIDKNKVSNKVQIIKCNDNTLMRYTLDDNILGLDKDSSRFIDINDSAFSNCTFLKELTFDIKSKEHIIPVYHSFSFFECYELENINIVSSNFKGYAFIKSGAFKHCYELTTFVKGYDKDKEYINRCSLDGDEIFCECNNLKEVHLLDTSTIGRQTFFGCINLENVEALSEILYIKDDAFRACYNLKNVHFGSLKELGDYAFGDCNLIDSFEFYNSIEYVGRKVFDGTSIKYNEKDGILYLGCKNAPYLVAFGVIDKNLTTYHLDKDCLVIAGEAFMGCKNLTSIIIPKEVRSIGPSAFEGCTSLKEIYLPRFVTRIGEQAFKGCSNLEKITLYQSVLKIDYQAFDGCTSLKKVVLHGTTVYGLNHIQIAYGNKYFEDAKLKIRGDVSSETINLVSIIVYCFAGVVFLMGLFNLITGTFFPDFVEQRIDWILSLGVSWTSDREILRKDFTEYWMYFLMSLGLVIPCVTIKIASKF